MPALDAGILIGREQDDRVKPGHDEMGGNGVDTPVKVKGRWYRSPPLQGESAHALG
jgi:hypothetical protein